MRLSQVFPLKLPGTTGLHPMQPADQRRLRMLVVICWINILAIVTAGVGMLMVQGWIPIPIISHTVLIGAVLLLIRRNHYRTAIRLFVATYVGLNFFNLLFADLNNFLYVVTSFLSVSVFLSQRRVVIYALAIVAGLGISTLIILGNPSYGIIKQEYVVMFVALATMIITVVSYVHDGDLREIEDQSQAISETAARLQSVLDSVPGFILRLDRDYRVLSIHSRTLEDTISIESLIGQPFNVLIADFLYQEVKATLDVVFQQGKIRSTEILGSEGRWYACHLAPQMKDGQVEAATVIAIDITDRKQTEEALKQSEERYRIISELASDFYFSYHFVSKDDVVIDWIAGGWERIIGYTREGLQARILSWKDITHPDDLTLIRHNLKKVSQNEKTVMEVRMIGRDGKLFWVRIHVYPIWDEAENRLVRAYAAVRDITETKVAEDERRKHEELYRLLARNLPNSAVFLFDHDLRYLVAEGESLAQHDFGSGGIEGKTLWEVLPPARAQKLAPAISRALMGETVNFEYMSTLGRSFVVNMLPIKDKQGSISAALALFQDVTGMKRADAALRESNQRYDELVANIPVMVYRVKRREGEDYRFDYVSPRSVQLNNIEPTALLENSQLFYDRVHPEDIKEMRRKEEIALSHTEPFWWEGRFLINGKTRWMHLESYPKRLYDGEIVWHGIQQDITAQKEAENALRESELLIAQIANTVPDIIYVVNAANRERIYANRSLGDELGYAPDEVTELERSFYASLIHPHDMVNVAKQSREIMALQDGEIVPAEYRLRHKDGMWRWFYTRSTVYARDETGKATQIFTVIQEITDRKTAEEDLLVAKNAAEAANRAKSLFIANTSHELRTPLNAIIGMAQLMSDDEHIPLEARKNIQVIHRSGHHLLELINDVLDLSGMETGRVNLEIQTFDLYSMLETVRDLLGFSAYSKGLDFSIQHQNTIPRFIKSDDKKMQQVLINLIGNAIKFTDSGYVTTLVRYDREMKMLHFEVSDSGCGIAQTEMPKLFELYSHVTSEVRTRQGVGLGLALSKKLVNMMGGDITANSVLGKGSTFRFHLPVVADESIIIEDKPIRGVLTTEPYRILVVDDYEDSRILMSELLKLPGIDVRTATGGQDGINVALEWQPHLIFMDVHMPVIDGYQAARQIRPALPNVVIIALTADILEDRTVFEDRLLKPFKKGLIFAALVKHLNIKYIYDENGTIINERSDGVRPQDMNDLPEAWREQFRQAAERARLDEVENLIEQIRDQHAPLASKLAVLAQRFDFEKLIEIANKPDDKA